MASYETVIGLEVHAQLHTSSKLFCPCSVAFGGIANEHVCEGCCGMPGALPKLNAKAVELAAKAGIALNCKVNEQSIFARKSYFYPDLPAGFQTSQYAPPICEGGYLDIGVGAATKRIGLTRIHLEDDAGKCVHVNGATLIDLNRAGTGLIEIVSEPDMRSAEDAVTYMRAIRAILVYIGATDGNMEEGSLRCDVNISLRPKGSKELGVRAEIKNLNSFRHIQRAIEYEIERQKNALEDKEPLVQETRLFDAAKQITISMRTKESAHDYRYMPNSDLPPVQVTREQLAAWAQELPELPHTKKQRFMQQLGLNEEEALALVAEREYAEYFEAVLALHNNPKRVVSLILGELVRECNQQGCRFETATFAPQNMAELARIIDEGLISTRIAHDIFPELFASNVSPKAYVEEKGLVQLSDSGELKGVLQAVLAANPAEVAAYKEGKTKLLDFFVGQAMRETKGKANPTVLHELLQKLLS